MAEIKLPVNMADVDLKSFEPVPENVYQVEVAKVTAKKSAKKKDYLSVELTIVEDENYAGRKVFDNISLQPQALFKLKQFCISSNFEIGDSFDPQDMKGLTATAQIDLEESKKKDVDTGEYEPTGEFRNVVKAYKFDA